MIRTLFFIVIALFILGCHTKKTGEQPNDSGVNARTNAVNRIKFVVNEPMVEFDFKKQPLMDLEGSMARGDYDSSSISDSCVLNEINREWRYGKCLYYSPLTSGNDSTFIVFCDPFYYKELFLVSVKRDSSMEKLWIAQIGGDENNHSEINSRRINDSTFIVKSLQVMQDEKYPERTGTVETTGSSITIQKDGSLKEVILKKVRRDTTFRQ